MEIFLEEMAVLDHESVYSREKNGLKTQLEQIQDLEEAKVGEITELYEKWYNGTMNFSKTGIKQWSNV